MKTSSEGYIKGEVVRMRYSLRGENRKETARGKKKRINYAGATTKVMGNGAISKATCESFSQTSGK